MSRLTEEGALDFAPIPPDYVLRKATIDDVDVIIHHRAAMFRDMNVPIDERRLRETFGPWLAAMMPAGVYHGWLFERADHIAAGGGITVLPWPPGPRDFSGQLPIVYNIYTEVAHRRRGLARAIMACAQRWCRDAGFGVMGLAASEDGRSLYESLGYEVAPQPYMFKAL